MENPAMSNKPVKTISEAVSKPSPDALLPDSKVLKRFSPLVRQTFAASGSLLCTVSAGMTVGYSAILLPQIRESKEFNFTLEQESWIASMAALPMAPGCLIGGVVMQILGRKSLNITVGVPFFLGWALLYFAKDFPTLMIGRFLQGISLGITGPLNSVFIGETTEPKLRGLLLASVSLGYAFGIVLVHTFGTFISWRVTALMCASVNIMSSLIFLSVPESPSFLLSKGRVDAAYAAFVWLRGCGTEANAEFQSMVQSQKNSNEEDKRDGKRSMFSAFTKASFVKPLSILLAMFFILQCIGINSIIFYTVTIMKDMTGNNFNGYYAMLVVDSVRFGIGIVACALIKQVNRRPLCSISGYGAGLCLLTISTFMYFSKIWENLNDYSVVLLVLIVGYICFSGLGLVPLPWCLIGELFPLRYRGIGSGIASASNFVFFFTVVKTAPFMFNWIGISGTFLIYGTFGIVGSCLLSFFLPETKNKTLQEIEDEFTGVNKNRMLENIQRVITNESTKPPLT